MSDKFWSGESEDEDNYTEPSPQSSEFLRRVVPLLPRLLGPGRFTSEPAFYNIRPDLIYTREDGQLFIIEVKATLPGTRERLQYAVSQLLQYSKVYRENSIGLRQDPEMVIVLNGVLSDSNLRLIGPSGVLVFDEQQLNAVEDAAPRRARPPYSDDLARMLTGVPPGRENYVFVRYQKIVRDILEYLFCPPLEKSIYESSDLHGFNRRDMIFPNYASDGIWRHLRETYQAHYIVVDAKNYSSKTKKKDVLQLANYLSDHGAGLFGMIVTRFEDDPGSIHTRRENWIVHRKLMIVLNDSDLLQMLTMKDAGDDPSLLIRQKIEDFRLLF